jgi:hypothetical protein
VPLTAGLALLVLFPVAWTSDYCGYRDIFTAS